MHFMCFECEKKFLDINITIIHMRKEHNIHDNVGEIKCIANYPSCKKTFVTYSGLRKHLLKCIKSTHGENAKFSEVSIFFRFYHLHLNL